MDDPIRNCSSLRSSSGWKRNELNGRLTIYGLHIFNRVGEDFDDHEEIETRKRIIELIKRDANR